MYSTEYVTCLMGNPNAVFANPKYWTISQSAMASTVSNVCLKNLWTKNQPNWIRNRYSANMTLIGHINLFIMEIIGKSTIKVAIRFLLKLKNFVSDSI